MLIEKSSGAPTVTNDGVTVAQEITLEHGFRNIGAQMVKDLTAHTSDPAGDGTTPATVHAQAIFREGIKAVSAGTGAPDAVIPDAYHLVAIQRSSAPEGGAGRDWHVYRIAQGKNMICGYRRGDTATVSADVERIVAGLNERRHFRRGRVDLRPSRRTMPSARSRGKDK